MFGIQLTWRKERSTSLEEGFTIALAKFCFRKGRKKMNCFG